MSMNTALTIGGLSISGVTAFMIGTGSAFISGGLGYAVRTGINDQESFEWRDMLIDASGNAVSGALTFFGAIGGGLIGIKVPGAPFNILNFTFYHLGLALIGVYTMKIFIALIKMLLKGIF